MRKLAKLFVGAVCSFAFPLSIGPTSAAVLKNFHVANWFGGAYSNDQTGAFSHCAGGSSYKSGISVHFIIDRNYRWSMGFSNPQWNLTKGGTYPIAFTVDSIPALNASAVAMGDTFATVKLADSTGLFQTFRRGHQLTVFAAGQLFEFALTDTSALLPALLQCVRERVVPPTVTAQTSPFEKRIASATEVTNSEADKKTEATTLLANILGQAGVTGFQLLKPAQYPQGLLADAAWSSNGAGGILRIIGPELKMEDISPNLISSDAKSCKGKFASGAMPDEKEANSVRVFTSCQGVPAPSLVYYSIFPRETGGHYLLATIASGAPDADKNSGKGVDADVVAAAYKVIKK